MLLCQRHAGVKNVVYISHVHKHAPTSSSNPYASGLPDARSYATQHNVLLFAHGTTKNQ